MLTCSCFAAQEVFFGLERHKKLIKITVDGLYAAAASRVVRTDRDLYEVFTLLATTKLLELGSENFRRLVLAQDHQKMSALLSFLWGPKQLKDGCWLESQWALIYDIFFVRDELLANMRSMQSEITKLVNDLEGPVNTGTGTSQSGAVASTKRSQSNVTVPRPFNLTRPSTKPFPEPTIEYDTSAYKATPVPQSSVTLKHLEEARAAKSKENHMKTMKKYASAKGFQLTERPMNAEALAEAAEAKRLAEMAKFKAEPKPDYPDAKPVKITAATILREDFRYRQQEMEEEAEIKRMEAELRDDSEFQRWQEKMREDDEQRREEQIAARKADAEMTSQQAQQAVENLIEIKRVEAEKIKAQAQVEYEAMRQQRREERLLKVKRKEEIIAAQAEIPIAVEKMVQKKKDHAIELQEQKKERARKVEEARRREMKERKELIKQIQTMERIAGARARKPKEVDRTTSSGLGMLNEMSLAELHERLNLMQVAQEEERERKNNQIREEKQAREDALSRIQARNNRRRNDRTQFLAGVKAHKQEERSEEQRREEAESLRHRLAVGDKLEAKRQERLNEALRLAEETRARLLKNQFIEAEKLKAHKRVQADLEKGRARQIADALAAQNAQAMLDADARNLANIDAQRVKKYKARKEAAAKREYDRRVARMRVEAQQYKHDELLLKQSQHDVMKRHADAATQAIHDLNPFAFRGRRRKPASTQRAESGFKATQVQGMSAAERARALAQLGVPPLQLQPGTKGFYQNESGQEATMLMPQSMKNGPMRSDEDQKEEELPSSRYDQQSVAR